MKYQFIIFFLLSTLYLHSQQSCTPSKNQTFIRYDFLKSTYTDSTYTESYCICDSGNIKSKISPNDKIYFCRRINISKKNKCDNFIEADFYKVNDSIWNANYYDHYGYIKESISILIKHNNITKYTITTFSPCPPYEDYIYYEDLIETVKIGKWINFNQYPYTIPKK